MCASFVWRYITVWAAFEDSTREAKQRLIGESGSKEQGFLCPDCRSTMDLVKMQSEWMRALAQAQQPSGKNTGCLNWRHKLAYSSISSRLILL